MRFTYFLFILFLFLSCAKKPSVPEEVILARVGEKLITIQDFIRRSEYTIRPDYCRQDNYIHKKIVLNSLIAEKLTSLEFEKQNSKFQSEDSEKYFKGRREQAMRQMLYFNEYFSKVNIPPDKIQSNLKLASRRVNLQFLNLPDESIAKKVQELDRKGVAFDSIHSAIWGGKAPNKEIGWFDREQEYIHKAVFDTNVKKGDLLGPFLTDENTHVLLKINSWTESVPITSSDQNLLWKDIDEKLTENKAKKEYLSWVQELMSNKKINFNSEIFYKYAEHAADYFFKMDSAKKQMFNQVLWDDPEIDNNSFSYKENKLSEDEIIFDYEGSPWSIKKLNQQLQSHPYVFRKRKMKRNEFPEQLRYAIADLMRDMEITKTSYNKGYNNRWNVKAYEEMWKDVHKSKTYLSSLRKKTKEIENQDAWLNFMNPKIDSLQERYSDKIQINMDAFEKIKLTQTDMMVIQRGVPYPIIVPSFPIITSDNKLNYGKTFN